VDVVVEDHLAVVVDTVGTTTEDHLLDDTEDHQFVAVIADPLPEEVLALALALALQSGSAPDHQAEARLIRREDHEVPAEEENQVDLHHPAPARAEVEVRARAHSHEITEE